MKNNVFIISDASYSSKSQCAGLGVIDLSTGIKYSKALHNIDTSNQAEYRALLFSVRIALQKKYDNVVFVYDNQSLNLDSLKLWLVGKIDSYQFLWLKRNFVDDADKLAKKARILHEKLIAKDILQKGIDDKHLVELFKTYSMQKILRAFITLANKSERQILQSIIQNNMYPLVLVEEESLDFFSDIYHCLPKEKNKERLYKYIDKNYAGNINHQKFTTPKPQSYYLEIIKKIISRLGKTNKISPKKKSTPKKLILNKSEKDATKWIKKVGAKSIRAKYNICIDLAKGEDKKFLDAYFNSKKAQQYNINKKSIELFLLVEHLLFDKSLRKHFRRFIHNRIKKWNPELLQKFTVRDNSFYIGLTKKLVDVVKV